MYAKKPRYRLTGIIMIVMLILGSLIGTVMAKYIYSKTLSAKVIFTAELADDFLLQEHIANKQSDGSYDLGTVLLPTKDELGNITKNGNAYTLLPGLDVPKDPFIKVIKKTPIEAYMYIEVVENLNSAITYTLDTAKWKPLTDTLGNQITGPNSGKVYFYTTDGTNALRIDETFPEDPVYLLSGGANAMITVSQKLLERDTAVNDILTFYAYLYEIGKTDGGVEWSAQETFEENQVTTP